MSTLTFGFSATLPDQMRQQPWDANWTAFASGLSWIDDLYALENYVGVGTPIESHGSIKGASIDVPTERMPEHMSADHILASYGNPPDAGATADILVQTTMMMFGSDPYFEQVITLMSLWNSVKDIAITNLLADYLSVTGFVDTWINAPHDDKNHVIYVDAAKRGAVALGNGHNFLEVGFAANEYTWPSHFDIALGNGNSEISVHPELSSRLAQLRAPPGWRFNSAPQLTTADITVGDGENVITLAEASGTIHVGGGTDTINILDGNSTVWLGSGFASVKVQSAGIEARGTEAFDTQVGTSDIYAGSGYCDISIDNSIPALTPRTTLHFMRGGTGNGSPATADAVHLGHVAPIFQSFVGGDLAAVEMDFAGYSPGSTMTLDAANLDGKMVLRVHDAATGGVDRLALYGAAVTDVAALNLRFVSS